MQSHLKSKYGYNEFRVCQKDIITDILNGENVIVVMSTGAGKSLCYQFPATYSNKISIVISPLISLMEDQQLFLEKKGIPCMCLNSVSISKNKFDECNVVYTTPEYFISNLIFFTNKLNNICLIAIDEAHCLSAWGHDFRPSYKKLTLIKEKFVNIPIMLLTATATPFVLDDIFDTIGFDDAKEYNLGTRRPNLHIQICQKTNLINDLKIIDKNESTIIYTQTRKKAEEVCSILLEQGFECEYFHAGMSCEERSIIHKKFSIDKCKILVATICFGMGIDKSNIRTIINWGAPCDIETYYQEIGRAGRDGINSKVIMFYEESDFITNRFLISKSALVEHRIKLLNIFKKYINNEDICRQILIEEYFETGNILPKISKDNKKCLKCDNCNRKETITQNVSILKEANMIINMVSSLPINYGITKLINALRGNCQSNLHSLINNAYYGVGKQYSIKWLKEIFAMLIQQDYLIQKPYKFYNVIKIGKVFNTNIFELKFKKDIKLTEYENIRKKIALEFNISPYMIINDNVLQQISNVKPTSSEELLMIDGINMNFVIKYGKFFLSENSTNLP